jgi:RNA polymerase-binding transcription factor DksA
MTRPKSDRTPGIRRGATSAAFADTRLRLLARKGELQTQLQELECDQRRAGRPLSADFAEQACERENDEVIDALLIRARKELVDVGRALMRIDAGSYGLCTVCGEPIEAPRLSAVPYTSRCGPCADVA